VSARAATAALTRTNLALSALTLLVLGGSFVLGVRGGAQNRLLDLLQLALVGSYVLATPALAVLVLASTHKTAVQRGVSIALLVLWLCVLLGSALLHF
jgi:hypothetical protein